MVMCRNSTFTLILPSVSLGNVWSLGGEMFVVFVWNNPCNKLIINSIRVKGRPKCLKYIFLYVLSTFERHFWQTSNQRNSHQPCCCPVRLVFYLYCNTKTRRYAMWQHKFYWLRDVNTSIIKIVQSSQFQNEISLQLVILNIYSIISTKNIISTQIMPCN